jgi:hypothetical protein
VRLDSQIDKVIRWGLVQDNRRLQLLAQWLKWWSENDEAPGKLPNALHVDTAVELISAYTSAWKLEGEEPRPC